MDGVNQLLLNSGSEPEPDTNISDSPCSISKSSRHSPPSTSAPSPKRSRRFVEKRVVSVPIQEVEGSPRAKGTSECAPPSDSWAWRKYGQKPIKGSPYPRGYYRCSSSKGCPARKQVERSHVDPTMLVVTYSCEHNHAWPLPKNHHQKHQHQHQQEEQAPAIKEEEPPDQDPQTRSPPESAVSSDPEESRFSDLIGMPDNDFTWFSEVGSASSTSPVSDTLLYCPIFEDRDSAELASPDEKISDDVDDALFAGLGELPEYSMVFRRGYLEHRMAAASW